MAGPGKPGPAKGDPRMVEAGHKGGAITRERGTEFFRAIGRLGGRACVERHGRQHLSEAGRKGGSVASGPRERRLGVVTRKMVAERAGVSVSTVALVLRGAPHVLEETRAAVRAAVAELGYTGRQDA